MMEDGRQCRTNHVSASPESFFIAYSWQHQHNNQLSDCRLIAQHGE